jgi:predicted Rossmann fold flavoprotein
MAEKNLYDVAIIGGGPAGMFAAIQAAKKGASVVLLEKNKKLGRKLLLTGAGRCNITNAEFDIKSLVSNYPKRGNFLFSAFSSFGPQEVITFFEKEGLKTKIERGRRVFPKNDKATSVLKTLIKCLAKNKVTVVCDAKVHRLSCAGSSSFAEGYGRTKDPVQIKKAVLSSKKEIFARSFVLCTGGLAYPVTGSTGDGYRMAKSLGHKIEETSPVLVPVKISESVVKDLQGLALKNIEITIEGEKRKIKKFGECLFTHYGMSGPIILEASKEIGEMKKQGEVKIYLDLKPALSEKELDKRLQKDFKKYANKMFKNALDDLLPQKMIPVVVFLTEVEADKKVNVITKAERKQITKILKAMKFTVKELMGYEIAITNTGGITLDEIDQKTMRSKKIRNLFFAGDILDIDGPTGGFNLQICWSTGFLAGESTEHLWKN